MDDAEQDSPDEAPRIRVAVIFGGRSSEHAISCLTARSVLAVLDPARFDVVPIGIRRNGQWVLGSEVLGELSTAPGEALGEVGPGVPVALGQGGGELVASPSSAAAHGLGRIDVVLPLLHGAFGEDGTMQGLLEMAAVRYVGSGVLASALAMDKGMAKTVLAAAGLPVGRWLVLAPGVAPGDPTALLERVAPLGWPVFVKPARAGSSFGVSRVTTAAELGPAISEAAGHDPKVIVEAAVVGREIECGVLGGPAGVVDVSVCGEILVDSSRALYDFDAKYRDDSGTRLVIPADLDPVVAAAARSLAAQAFTALGCEGLARVDMFLTADGGLIVNEVNTMPGFTPTSMFPQLWAATGLDYPALVSRLVDTALARPLGLR